MAMNFGIAEQPKPKKTFKDYAFYGVVGFFALSTLGSVGKIMDPEGTARREQEAALRKAEQASQAVAAKPSRADYKVVEIVTACDMVTKRAVKNPSSLSTAWSWKEVPTSRGVAIYRNFTAMNGFGANLDSYYVCSYDAIDKKFVNYEIFDGNY